MAVMAALAVVSTVPTFLRALAVVPTVALMSTMPLLLRTVMACGPLHALTAVLCRKR